MKEKTPYETMQELSTLIGEINCTGESALKLRGEKPEDVPPKDYCDFVAARLVDAGCRKERTGRWIRKQCYHESEFCPHCGAKMGIHCNEIAEVEAKKLRDGEGE